MERNITAVHIRNFRSIAATTVDGCGGLNVFIGKNNAGKSNILAAIQQVLDHLRTGELVMRWPALRPPDEFNEKNSSKILQVGVEFALPHTTTATLCEQLNAIAPHLSKSTQHLKQETSIAFLLRFSYRPGGAAFRFVESIALGKIVDQNGQLSTSGINLITVPEDAATQLFAHSREVASLKQRAHELKRITGADREELARLFDRDSRGSPPRSYWLRRYVGEDVDTLTVRELMRVLDNSASVEDFIARIGTLQADTQEKMEAVQSTEIDTPLNTYTGAVKTPPSYASTLMTSFGNLKVLHFRENKAPIGKEEAQQLLALKVRRGGPEQLSSVQNIVRNLLGVSIDAFEGQRGPGEAEMDVDEFLVEANGAGIREALRLVLDIELKSPNLILLEEPEVHLHPGLEFAVHSYLQDKSSSIQMFVTTHSTNFVDAVSFQNIYLVTKDWSKKTICERILPDDAPVKLPAELGLRLSTVFMFDRLVFVEGPSDEAVLRECARILNFDLAKAGVAFVHMGGVRNFTHYAAEGTINLLSRRQIRMWFVVDRDERDDKDIQNMIARLGSSAALQVHERRELENYLLVPRAIAELIGAKTHPLPTPSVEQVRDALDEIAAGARDEVVRLWTHKHALAPVYLQNRAVTGSVAERLDSAIAELTERRRMATETNERLKQEYERDWSPKRAFELASGTWLLERVFQKFKTTFNKEAGDSARLAKLLQANEIDEEIAALLRKFVL